jgi:hypothetical protein
MPLVAEQQDRRGANAHTASSAVIRGALAATCLLAAILYTWAITSEQLHAASAHRGPAALPYYCRR